MDQNKTLLLHYHSHTHTLTHSSTHKRPPTHSNTFYFLYESYKTSAQHNGQCEIYLRISAFTQVVGDDVVSNSVDDDDDGDDGNDC